MTCPSPGTVTHCKAASAGVASRGISPSSSIPLLRGRHRFQTHRWNSLAFRFQVEGGLVSTQELMGLSIMDKDGGIRNVFPICVLTWREGRCKWPTGWLPMIDLPG